ncbi:MAG: hypothetical protein R3B89_00520 [Polyangiaceae bacterium]
MRSQRTAPRREFSVSRCVLALGLGGLAATLTQGALASEPPREASAFDSATRGLLLDVERILDSQEGSGWFMDQHELDEAYPTLLESVCRSPLAARRAALRELEREAKQAGDPREAFAKHHELDDATQEALHATRALQLFQAALDGAEADCPFWVEQDAEFSGRQTDNGRWTLNLETGGVLQVRQTEGSWTYGGGGAGRVLAGKNFGGPLTLLFGGEFGGGAMLKPNTDPSEFVLNYFPAAPLIFRIRNGSWHYELETAGVSLFQADNGNVSFGGRIGAGIGLWALRTRNVLPWAGFAVAYEFYPESGGRERAHFFRGGLRVGFSFDAQ